MTSGIYGYEPFANDDNLIEIAGDDGVGKHRFDTGLTALMRSPHDESEDYFDLAGQHYLGESAEESIAGALLANLKILGPGSSDREGIIKVVKEIQSGFIDNEQRLLRNFSLYELDQKMVEQRASN